MALMTAPQFRTEYYPEVTGTGEDTVIATLIQRFDALAAAYCGFPAAPGSDVDGDLTLESAAYVLYLDGPDAGKPQVLRLGVRPVTAIASIYDDPDRVYGSDRLVSSSDYDLLGERGVVLLKTTSSHGAWYQAFRSQKVSCTVGFATVPPSIKGALGLQVRHWLRNYKSIGTDTVSQGDVTKTIRELTLLPSVKQILAPHVNLGGACG